MYLCMKLTMNKRGHELQNSVYIFENWKICWLSFQENYVGRNLLLVKVKNKYIIVSNNLGIIEIWKIGRYFVILVL